MESSVVRLMLPALHSRQRGRCSRCAGRPRQWAAWRLLTSRAHWCGTSHASSPASPAAHPLLCAVRLLHHPCTGQTLLRNHVTCCLGRDVGYPQRLRSHGSLPAAGVRQRAAHRREASCHQQDAACK